MITKFADGALRHGSRFASGGSLHFVATPAVEAVVGVLPGRVFRFRCTVQRRRSIVGADVGVNPSMGLH